MEQEQVVEPCRWCGVRPGGFADSAWCEPCTNQVLLAQAHELRSSRQERQVVGDGPVLSLVRDRRDWWDQGE